MDYPDSAPVQATRRSTGRDRSRISRIREADRRVSGGANVSSKERTPPLRLKYWIRGSVRLGLLPDKSIGRVYSDMHRAALHGRHLAINSSRLAVSLHLVASSSAHRKWARRPSWCDDKAGVIYTEAHIGHYEYLFDTYGSCPSGTTGQEQFALRPASMINHRYIPAAPGFWSRSLEADYQPFTPDQPRFQWAFARRSRSDGGGPKSLSTFVCFGPERARAIPTANKGAGTALRSMGERISETKSVWRALQF